MANLQAVVDLLQRSLDPKQQKQAEATINEASQQPGFSLALLQIIGSETFPQTSRLAAALYFKNLIRRGWTDEDGNHKLPQDEVSLIKRELVGLMTSCPANIQAQLGDVISVIADSDFWQRWDTLMQDLVSRLSPENPVVSNGVLQVAHTIFKRWRPLFRSDELFTEINHVLTTFATPFLQLLAATDNAISQNQANKDLLSKHMAVLDTSLKILYDLCSQDMPDAVVDNLENIAALLDKYLKYDNPLLHTNDESEAGPLDLVKSSIFGVLTLWVQKYEEDVSKYISSFVESSWNLLTTTGTDVKYDILVSRAMLFLTSVTGIQQHAQAFNNEATLNQVVEKVILPNIMLRESDVEMFEDEPIEYIRRDLEGADSETRRKAATDFLRKLMEQFPELVTRVTMGYISHYIQDYSKDQAENFRSKDTAVYLFCSIAAVGTITTTAGVKTTNPNVNVIEFFTSNVAEDLTSTSSHPILQVDAIKFLYTFRSQISQAQWNEAFPMLVRHLGSRNYVVHTYCAIAIERILYLTNDQNEPVIPRASVTPLAQDMLRQVFTLVAKSTAAEKVQENEFLMRCVMRILIVIKEDVASLVDFLLTSFTNIMRLIRHNPSNPRFYYYMFEGFGALIRFAAPSQPEKLEKALFEPFSTVLQEDVAEFVPYVFQLFAALLEANPTAPLPESFASLIQPVLTPSLWDVRGNTPALVRLLSAMVSRGSSLLVGNKQLEPVLGIFQKLLASKSTEIYGFDLLETIITSIPREALAPYWPNIFTILLTRLSSSKTEALTIRFVRLFHFLAARDDRGYGTDAVVAIAEGVQQGVFASLYSSIILPDTQKLLRPLDRKTAVISFTKTIADSDAFANNYAKGWARTCEALLKLMQNPPIPPAADDAIVDQDADDTSFGVGFTQLSTCKRAPADPFPDVQDVKAWVRQYLTAASQSKPRVGQFVQERLNDEMRQALIEYIRA